MRLTCYFCGKSVSNEVPEETVVRASLQCPECLVEIDRQRLLLLFELSNAKAGLLGEVIARVFKMRKRDGEYVTCWGNYTVEQVGRVVLETLKDTIKNDPETLQKWLNDTSRWR